MVPITGQAAHQTRQLPCIKRYFYLSNCDTQDICNTISNMNEEVVQPSIRIIERTETTITPEEIQKLDDMVERELTLHEQSGGDPRDREVDARATSAGVHIMSNRDLIRRVEEKSPLQVVFAENANGDIIGYSIVIFDPGATDPTKRVANTYIGVESAHQRQGIGLQLLQTRHAALQRMGIRSYETTAREVVRKLYDKLGVSYQVLGAVPGTVGNRVRINLTP